MTQTISYQLPNFEFEGRQDSSDITREEDNWFQSHSDHLPLRDDELSDKDTEEDIEGDIEEVTWNGLDDPENPYNWAAKRKWTVTILVSCLTFISPFSSTMVTPVLDVIGEDFNITSGSLKALVMSIFLLGYAVGPFILAPLSEIFGRVAVLQYANLVYLLFNTVCGFAKTKEQILAFRFLSGIGGSAPQALCNGVLADTWKKEERGKGQAVYGLLTFTAPAIAPIIGAFVADNLNWRWIFWIISIFDVVVQLLALLFLKETYATVLLSRKAKTIRQRTGNSYPRTRHESRPFLLVLRRALLRPLVMLFLHPAVQVPSLYRAYMYGVQYLMFSTFNKVFEEYYKMSPKIASLNYLSLGIGSIIGLQLGHPLIDKLYAYYKVKYNTDEGVPEWRVPPMLVGGLIAPIGLFMYGWGVQSRTHWTVPNLGSVIFCIGLLITFQSAQAYIVDAYGVYSASASVAGAFLRTMCGFTFPLFAPAMYDKLGIGWGNSLLAFLTLALAIPSPILLWLYGPKLRAISNYIPD